jgi:hypothetical protein
MFGGLVSGVTLGLALGLAHYFGEVMNPRLEKYHSELISLAAGIFVTLLFIDLLPAAANSNLNFSLILLGFIIYHSLERVVYQRHPSQFDTKQLSVAGFFFANFLNGVTISLIFGTDPELAYFVFFPMLLTELASSTMLSKLLERMQGRSFLKILLAASVFLGALAASFLNPDKGFASNVFAFVIGTTFYIVIRDMLPKHREGNLAYFLIGVIVMYFVEYMAVFR